MNMMNMKVIKMKMKIMITNKRIFINLMITNKINYLISIEWIHKSKIKKKKWINKFSNKWGKNNQLTYSFVSPD
jgi:hypothetical protein